MNSLQYEKLQRRTKCENETGRSALRFSVLVRAIPLATSSFFDNNARPTRFLDTSRLKTSVPVSVRQHFRKPLSGSDHATPLVLNNREPSCEKAKSRWPKVSKPVRSNHSGPRGIVSHS